MTRPAVRKSEVVRTQTRSNPRRGSQPTAAEDKMHHHRIYHQHKIKDLGRNNTFQASRAINETTPETEHGGDPKPSPEKEHLRSFQKEETPSAVASDKGTASPFWTKRAPQTPLSRKQRKSNESISNRKEIEAQTVVTGRLKEKTTDQRIGRQIGGEGGINGG